MDTKPQEPDESSNESLAGGTEFFLAQQEEFRLLLKGVEENSKHARTIMFTLIGTCVYVFLATFSKSIAQGVEHLINLPIINVSVTEREFFFFSPIIILIAYIYLHIYIRELRKRLDSVNVFFREREFNIKDPNQLLFPWIIVFAFQHQLREFKFTYDYTTDDGMDVKGIVKYYSERRAYLVRLLTVSLLWLLGPIVLLILWAKFIDQRQAVTMVPCLCFVMAIVTSRSFAFARLGIILNSLVTIITAGMVIYTLSSVPTLSEFLHIKAVWLSINGAINDAASFHQPWWLYVIIGIIIIQFMPFIAWLILRLFGRMTLSIRLKLVDFLWDAPVAHVPFFVSTFLFTETNIGRGRKWLGIPEIISDDVLKGHTLWSQNFLGMWFKGADLCRAHLSRSMLKGANFSEANLSSAWLDYCDMEDANFKYAIMDNIDLVGANLSGANLMQAVLKGGRLNHANFTGAYFKNADLQGAILYDACLRAANLTGANLTGANLDRADLTDSILENIILDYSKFSKQTKFPVGFKIRDTMILIDGSKD